MKQTVATSELYKLRPQLAERNVRDITEAIKNKDFEKMSDITMRDAMMMHATMLDTKPPILYLNDVSKDIIYAIENMNAEAKKVIAAYTFDAGPNACVITLKKNKDKILKKLNEIDGVENVIICKTGEGPKILGKNENLIDTKALTPILKNKR